MRRLRFHGYQGWQTLCSRPGLSVLAIALLTFSLGLCAAVFGSLLTLQDVRKNLLENLTASVELQRDVTDHRRAQITSVISQWPGVAGVTYMSPDSLLSYHSSEVGENLQDIFGGNPFPPELHIQFRDISYQHIDTLIAKAARWEGITDIIYPRELWERLDIFIARLRGGAFIGTVIILLASLILIGLVLRAQFAGRREEWRLLLLLGMTPAGLRTIALAQAAGVGVTAGVFTVIGVWMLQYAYSIVFLDQISLPAGFCPLLLLSGIVLSLVVGFAVSSRVKLIRN